MEEPLREEPVIRRARRGEARAVLEVFEASIRGLARGHYRPDQIDSWCGLLSGSQVRAAAADGTLYVVAAGSRIAGFGRFNPGTGNVGSLYVHPEFAGRGYGLLLMDHFEGVAREHHLDTMHLRASLNALGFYLHCGFREVARVMHAGTDGTLFECSLMEKRLE